MHALRHAEKCRAPLPTSRPSIDDRFEQNTYRAIEFQVRVRTSTIIHSCCAQPPPHAAPALVRCLKKEHRLRKSILSLPSCAGANASQFACRPPVLQNLRVRPSAIITMITSCALGVQKPPQDLIIVEFRLKQAITSTPSDSCSAEGLRLDGHKCSRICSGPDSAE